MKRLITTLATLLCFASWLSAMDYETAREQAYYLTDKMAYELNLNEEQYDDAFEINLDYLLSLNDEKDIDAAYLTYRNEDLRLILLEWQWEAFLAATYFRHPVYWVNGGWYFPVLRYYDPTRFFYPRPRIFWDYRGAHGRSHFVGGSYYANRRPAWNGGLRGNSSTKAKRPAGSGSGQRGSTAGSSARPAARSPQPSSGQRGNTKAAGSNSKPGQTQGMRSSSRSTVNNGNRTGSTGTKPGSTTTARPSTNSRTGAGSSQSSRTGRATSPSKTASPSGQRSSSTPSRNSGASASKSNSTPSKAGSAGSGRSSSAGSGRSNSGGGASRSSSAGASRSSGAGRSAGGRR